MALTMMLFGLRGLFVVNRSFKQCSTRTKKIEIERPKHHRRIDDDGMLKKSKLKK